MTPRAKRCYQCSRTEVLVPVRVFGLGLRRVCPTCADRLTAIGMLERIACAACVRGDRDTHAQHLARGAEDPRQRRQDVPDGLDRRFRPRWLRRATSKDLSGEAMR
jgi:hypothetical protein